VKEVLASPLFREISLLPEKRRETVLKEQGIEDFFTIHFFKKESHSQLKYRNALLLETAYEIMEVLKKGNVNFCFIKGIVFLESLYPSLEDRFLSDIDILVSEDQFEEVISLVKHNFPEADVSRGSWVGDAHKVEVQISNEYNLEITVEFHSKLFWHTDFWGTSEVVKDKGLYRPKDEDHFVYLIYHYAFQHNCQKLYWLLDILYFYQENKDQLDWGYINKKIKEIKIVRSSLFVKKILCREFGINMSQLNGQTWIPFYRKYLLEANQRSLYYLFLKFFLKDKIFKQGLFYSIKWLKYYRKE
tara:strand:+ start:111122 stop:112027 length:906 start_codon:yes stop_codon:yes gene_type:complete